jgi:sulfatase maturation enzyme AslB (radical SAM superfamily)
LLQLSEQQFQREYFDWSREEFANRFVEKVTAGRLKLSDTFVDLKLDETKSLGQKLERVWKEITNLPNVAKMNPEVGKRSLGSYYKFLHDFILSNRSRDFLYWWMHARRGFQTPLFGSADIINTCNLKCKHCYWWTTREPTSGELTPEQWRIVIQNSFRKLKISHVTVVGGEPILRKDVIQVFSEEMKNRISVVTNGTFPLIHINGVYFVSIDGTEEIHNQIRGPKTYTRIKENVKNYVDAGGRVNINMTLNTLNYTTVMDVLHEWDEIAERISIQFHTPFVDNDPLWLPFGEKRNKTIDSILEYSSNENKRFVINSREQLNYCVAIGDTNAPTG